MRVILGVFCLFIYHLASYAQVYRIQLTEHGAEKPVLGAHISLGKDDAGVIKMMPIGITDQEGSLSIDLSAHSERNLQLLISHVAYKNVWVPVSALTTDTVNEFFLETRVLDLSSIDVIPSSSVVINDLVQIPATTVKVNESKKQIAAFRAQRYEVTVGEFKEFIEATGYQTEVENKGISVAFIELKTATPQYLKRFKKIKKETFKQAKKLKFKGYERSFETHFSDTINWRHDEFGQIRSEDEMNFPVINITLKDAEAFAKWAGMRLPTYEEWLALCQNAKPMGWLRNNSTGVIREVSSSPLNKQKLGNVFGNVSEFIQGRVDAEEPQIQVSALNVFTSSVIGPTETWLIKEQELFSTRIKVGFRCVVSED